jgi:hypothetical protein
MLWFTKMGYLLGKTGLLKIFRKTFHLVFCGLTWANVAKGVFL